MFPPVIKAVHCSVDYAADLVPIIVPLARSWSWWAGGYPDIPWWCALWTLLLLCCRVGTASRHLPYNGLPKVEYAGLPSVSRLLGGYLLNYHRILLCGFPSFVLCTPQRTHSFTASNYSAASAHCTSLCTSVAAIVFGMAGCRVCCIAEIQLLRVDKVWQFQKPSTR